MSRLEVKVLSAGSWGRRFPSACLTRDFGSLLLLVDLVLLIFLVLLLKVVQVANVGLLHAHQAGQTLHVLVPEAAKTEREFFFPSTLTQHNNAVVW